MKRIFLYTNENSNKFWTIQVTGNKFTLNYGGIGTKGNTQVKEFDSEDACCMAAEKLIAEKLKKGYIESKEIPQPRKLTKKEFEEAVAVFKTFDYDKIKELLDQEIPLYKESYPIQKNKYRTDKYKALPCMAKLLYAEKKRGDKEFSKKAEDLLLLLVDYKAFIDINDIDTIPVAYYYDCEKILAKYYAKGYHIYFNGKRGSVAGRNYSDPHIMEALVQYGLNPFEVDDEEGLHRGVKYWSNKLLRKVIEEFKPDLNKLDANGYTALDIIENECNYRVTPYIKEYKRNAENPKTKDIRNSDFETPVEIYNEALEKLKNRDYLIEIYKNAPPLVPTATNDEEKEKIGQELLAYLKTYNPENYQGTGVSDKQIQRYIDAGIDPNVRDENKLTTKTKVRWFSAWP